LIERTKVLIFIDDGIYDPCPGQEYSDSSLLGPEFLEGFFKIKPPNLSIEWSLAFPHPIEQPGVAFKNFFWKIIKPFGERPIPSLL
jgi:hypothetical protein